MKKWMAMLLALGILFLLTGCQKEEPEPEPTLTPYDLWQLSQVYQQRREEEALSRAASDLKISNVLVQRSGTSTVCKGSVTNESDDTTYKYVKVKGAFKDATGTVVDTDWSYAVGSEGLAPGESSSFSIYVDAFSIKDCEVTIFEADAE